jgi:IclR family acetate operon transcriptional repressor
MACYFIIMKDKLILSQEARRGPDKVTAVDRVVWILEALGEAEGLRLSEVSRVAHLTEATAWRYLSRLALHGFVERDEGSERYRLGSRLFQLGQRALSERDPREVALPIMAKLRAEYDETVNLAMRIEDELVLVEALESTRSIRKGARVGESDVWHSSSVGKAILAYLPEHEALRILERRGCPRTTPKTLATADEFLRDFEGVRERGYAIDDEESEEGLCCVGAPVFDRHRRPSYAFSFSGPANRFSPGLAHEMGRAVKGAARTLSLKLGYPGEADGKYVPSSATGKEGSKRDDGQRF